MKIEPSCLVILMVLVTTLGVATTLFEIGIPEQKAYARLCPAGYHWDDDENKCVSN